MQERKEHNERQELMEKLLEDANIPALSFSWSQKGTRYSVASGKTDTSAPRPVDTNTLFQAASLSKPVSAAIVLDLVAQGKWDLDKPLFEYDESYGPLELRQPPYDEDYKKLTTAMIIGQCSGLANFGEDGDDGKKFIAKPNTRFCYSGVALDFLKQVIEKELKKDWEAIAQDFFKKAGMESSTFKRQLPGGLLHDIPRDVASAHKIDSSSSVLVPLPPFPDSYPGIPAGSLLTTANDYISFLQYCFKEEPLKSKLLKAVLSTLPAIPSKDPTSPPTSQVQWGLGMGLYRDNNSKKMIAFHWGNNTGSISFCAMDIATGDSVVSFANSTNGPTVFEQVAEPIVGHIKPLFEWLAQYCDFKDKISSNPAAIAETVRSIHSLAKTDSVEGIEITSRFKQGVKQLQDSDTTPTNADSKTSMNP